MRGEFRRVCSVGLFASLLGAACAWTQNASEYDIKAAFLLNFTKFIEWPRDAFSGEASPIAICILGNDPFGRALDEIVRGESVSGHRLEVRRIGQVADLRGCQVLFVEQSGKETEKILRRSAHGVLTVGEGESFLKDGGMIGFVIDDRRVRFDINQAAAERAGLKLSSRLLRVARTVEGGRS